jgi:tetratricopeptide (TPR) repeat protein
LPEPPLQKIAEATRLFPEDPQLLSFYGDLLILHRHIEEAVDVFARVETLQPDNPEIRSRLVYSLLALGDRDRAVTLLEEIAARRPDQHRIWFYIAALHEQADATDLADAAYAKAITIRPDDPEPYLKRAFLLLAADRPAEAETALRAAIGQVSGDPRIDEMIGYSRLALDDAAGAVDAFARAYRVMSRRNSPPALTHFHLNYALAQTDLGQVGEAARQLGIAVRADPDSIERYMSRIFRDRRDREALATALLVLDRMNETVPRSADAYTLYGMIAHYAEDYAAALTLFERAEQFAVDAGEDEDLNETFFFWMGAAAERTKEYDKAETAFLDAITRRPDYADAHNYLAYMHAERGVKLEMAYDHIGVALAVEPENPAFLDTRGWIYYQMGRYEEALVDIEAAIALMPDDPTIADHLGDIHLKLGNPAEALHWWKVSLAADPENEQVAEKIRTHESSLAPPLLEPISP